MWSSLQRLAVLKTDPPLEECYFSPVFTHAVITTTGCLSEGWFSWGRLLQPNFRYHHGWLSCRLLLLLQATPGWLILMWPSLPRYAVFNMRKLSRSLPQNAIYGSQLSCDQHRRVPFLFSWCSFSHNRSLSSLGSLCLLPHMPLSWQLTLRANFMQGGHFRCMQDRGPQDYLKTSQDRQIVIKGRSEAFFHLQSHRKSVQVV
jgi:hypothetical protein